MTEQRPNRQATTFRVLSILAGLSLIASGVPKLLGVEQLAQNFARWGYPPWFLPVVGVIEVVGGIATLLPRTRFYGAALLTGTMGGAILTHLRFGEIVESVPSLVLGAICAIVAWGYRPAFLRTAHP
jgi:putative oxidoreductase